MTFESAGFNEGRIYSGGAYYHVKDHLGSIRLVMDQTGSVKEQNDYYPFGMRQERSNYALFAGNRFKYNGKEEQITGGLGYLDYGARMYDAESGRWFGVDPLLEKYYGLSPYAYCGNNPLIYIDPTGMEIESNSQEEWERNKNHISSMKERVQRRINSLKKRSIKNTWSEDKLAYKIGNREARIASLDNTLATMTVLENSTQVYRLSVVGAGENGGVSLDKGTNVANISYGVTANFVHEVTHAGQFETGDIAFNAETGGTLAQDIYDEIAAYQAQFAYDPGSISGLSSTHVAKSFNAITPAWVQGLAGGSLYVPGGNANTGIESLNINSTRADFIKAYPNSFSVKQLPKDYILKNSYPNIYYKK